ncbi:MAG: chemotaxis protein CheW [Polyangiales bacterium]
MARTRQLCTFHLQDLYLGVDVTRVQEVIRYQEMTRVPLASPEVRGLINLRGQIVTALELRTRLGLPPRAADRQPMNVVIRVGDATVSLLVDEIGDVVEVSDDAFERVPDTLPADMRSLCRGVYKLNPLLLLLDPERAVGHRAEA